jgi:hypothetical protein
MLSRSPCPVGRAGWPRAARPGRLLRDGPRLAQGSHPAPRHRSNPHQQIRAPLIGRIRFAVPSTALTPRAQGCARNESATAKKREDKWAALTLAVVKVGDGGRGFIVETEHAERVVITASRSERQPRVLLHTVITAAPVCLRSSAGLYEEGPQPTLSGRRQRPLAAGGPTSACGRGANDGVRPEADLCTGLVQRAGAAPERKTVVPFKNWIRRI